MAVYGYARCSTNEDRQDLDRQARELVAKGAGEIYSEYLRGSADVKPEQERLFAALVPGDTVIVTEVSRLARNVHQLCHLEEHARERRVKLQCGALCLDYTEDKIDPMCRGMFYMMGVFAEIERGVTVERIVSGLANAKAKGIKGGRRKKTADDVPQSVKDLIPEYERGEITAAELARRVGLSRQVIYKYFALLGIGVKESRQMTAAAVPLDFRNLYEKHKAGEIGMSELATLAGVSRKTAYNYVALIERKPEGENVNDSTPND